MRNGSAGREREFALSEVIGFVLIIGVIVVLASLYLVYGVPAQGRENEILHMNEVKDQFVTYKVGLDSLFTNNKIGTTISNSFTPGTSGGYSQGTFSFLPVLNPVSSGGTIAVNPVGTNQRVTDNETFTLTSDSLILNNTVNYAVDYAVGTPATINYTPSHVYVNISNPSSKLNINGVYGWTVNTTSWAATINLTPQATFYQTYQACPNACTSCSGASKNGTPIDVTSGGNPACLVPINIFNYTQSDLTISISKNNLSTMQNYPVYRNIQAQPYTIDLMNNAYGLSSAIQPSQTIALYPFDNPASISATGNITYNFAEMNPYTFTPIPLGSIEYQAQNNYWVTQKYYYQMGGVFLQQADGNTTYKLPPEITFAYDNPANPKILTVSINALSIDPAIPSNHGTVGGNSPVQLKTTLTNITTMPFVTGTANTKQISMCVNTTDNKAREMWKNYFDYTAKVANVPTTDYDPPYFDGTKSCITLKGYDHGTSATADYDIKVIASNATYMTTVYGIGGIVQ